MTSWEKGFAKEAALGNLIGKIKAVGRAFGTDPATLRAAQKATDRAFLKMKPKGGYAALDAASTAQDFNPSGFLRKTKIPVAK